MDYITAQFPISNEEYNLLDKKFGKLMYFQMHSLFRQNSGNNIADAQEDFVQDLRLSLIKVGSYQKRQEYIDACLTAARNHAEQDSATLALVERLEYLWANKTRHGANRQRFGPKQEEILERIVRETVPAAERPDKSAKLNLNERCIRYCKTSLWNVIKGAGKKITKDKPLRNRMVSLGCHSHLASDRSLVLTD